MDDERASVLVSLAVGGACNEILSGGEGDGVSNYREEVAAAYPAV
mgnify:CR=1 FL=1